MERDRIPQTKREREGLVVIRFRTPTLFETPIATARRLRRLERDAANFRDWLEIRDLNDRRKYRSLF